MRCWLLTVGLAVSGCAALSGPQERLTAGASLEQHQPITVPAGRHFLWLQDGRIGLNGVMAWRSPYCELRPSGPAAQERVLAPGRYTVESVRYETLIGAGLPWRVAGPSLAGEIGDGDEHALFRVTLTLADRAGGGLESVMCALRDNLRDGRHPSIEQLQATLSPYFALHRPGD